MAETLTDRASLVRAFYRLTNTDATDDALIEHDPAGFALEAVYQALQYGVWDAQEYLIERGMRDRWVKSTAALSFTDEAVTGFQYTDLPDDLLRVDADDERTGIRRANERWGQLIHIDDRWRGRGNYYWTQNERLYLARSANPPANLYLDYFFRHDTLADDTTVDFPERERPLIPAYATVRAMAESWLPGGPEMEVKLQRNLDFLKSLAGRRIRRTRSPQKVRPQRVIGTHWFT
jgi:hypothetical protein